MPNLRCLICNSRVDNQETICPMCKSSLGCLVLVAGIIFGIAGSCYFLSWISSEDPLSPQYLFNIEYPFAAPIISLLFPALVIGISWYIAYLLRRPKLMREKARRNYIEELLKEKDTYGLIKYLGGHKKYPLQNIDVYLKLEEKTLVIKSIPFLENELEIKIPFRNISDFGIKTYKEISPTVLEMWLIGPYAFRAKKSIFFAIEFTDEINLKHTLIFTGEEEILSKISTQIYNKITNTMQEQ